MSVQLGLKGERIAARYLMKKGYRIIEKNYSCRFGELDLIAKKGDILCFVEVKLRSSTVYGAPAESIGWKKKSRILKTIDFYLYSHDCAKTNLRVDVIELLFQEGKSYINHIEGAVL